MITCEDGKVRMAMRCSVLTCLEKVFLVNSLSRIGKSSGRRWFFGKVGSKAIYFIKDGSNVPPKEGWNVVYMKSFEW